MKKHLMIAIICFAVGVPAATALIYWTSDPVAPIRHVPLDHSVKPGEDLVIESEVVRHKLCQTKIERTIYDGKRVRWVLSDIDYASAPGPLGYQKYKQRINVPRHAAAGAGQLFIGLVWKCPGIGSMFSHKSIIGPIDFEIE